VELATVLEINDEELEELEQINQQLPAKRQKLARLVKFKNQIAEASDHIKSMQNEAQHK
jgi:hypothetical protein